MSVTNEDIMEKLNEMTGLLHKIQREEKILEEEEKEIITEEKEELKLLKQLHGKDIKRRFENIAEWKQHIWDDCTDKEEFDTLDSLDYVCKKTGKSCRFLDCYRNKAE